MRSGLIAPEQRHVVSVEIPGEREKDGHTEEGPEEEADREGGHQRGNGSAVSAGGDGEEDAAGERDAAGDGDAESRRGEALLPICAGNEEGAIEGLEEGQDEEEEGEDLAEFDEDRRLRGERWTACWHGRA
jgi:hypothetical protein